MVGRMGIVTVRRKALADIEARGATGDLIEQRGRHDGAGDLRDYIRQYLTRRKTAACGKANRHRRIEMAAGDVTDRIGHGHDAQPECERYPKKANTDLRKAGGNHGAPASGKGQPE